MSISNVRTNERERINFRIRVPQVRLIDHTGAQLGVVDTKEAMRKAQEAGLDLVEVSPLERPPVCRILDYGKFKYQQKKKQHQTHHVAHLKGIRLSPKIQVHDLTMKVEQAKKFLERGDKVHAMMRFHGREMAHQEIGREVMRRFVEMLGDEAKVEKDMHMEGQRLNLIVTAGRRAKPQAQPRPAASAKPKEEPKQAPPAAPTPA